jgi:hypothetical protein
MMRNTKNNRNKKIRNELATFQNKLLTVRRRGTTARKTNAQPQKKSNARRNRRKNPNGRQTNNTTYGGQFVSKKSSSRDYRCVVAEETVGIQASTGSSTFSVLGVYNLNPGNVNTFPLLSIEAAVFETYHFEYLEFYTVPSVSGYAAGGQQGSVSLSVDFNASHAAPSTYTAAVDLDPNSEDLPCNDLDLVLPYEKMHIQNIAKFVRQGGLPGSSDIKTYDVGNLFVCAEGLSPTVFNVNRLYCRYKCHLYTRVDVRGAGPPQNNSVTQYFESDYGLTTEIPAVIYFEESITDGIGIPGVSGIFTPPAGNYLVNVELIFSNTSAALTFASISMFVNAIDIGDAIWNLVAVANVITLSFTSWVPCSGKDTVSIQALTNFGSGSTNAKGNIIFLAI